MLDGIRHMYEGLQLLTGDDWHTLFNRIISESRNPMVFLPHAIAVQEGCRNVTWAPGHPTHRSPSFSEAALKLTARTLATLDPPPSQVILTQLSGGFSGAFVVRAELPDRPASFVIKMDEDPRKIFNEFAGYHRVRSLLSHNHYLSLFSDEPLTLTPDWWGAFAMVYEEVAKPLIEYSQLEGLQLAKLYERIWNECLRHLYGRICEHDLSVENILSKDSKDSARDGFGAIKRYKSRISELNPIRRSAIESSLAFVEGLGDSNVVEIASLGVPWAERVHGDLNCRNVLYNDRHETFRLIDFPHVGQPNCLAVDFVKAETELVLIMMDWATGYDCDFARLEIWGTLTEVLSANFQLSLGSFPDTGADCSWGREGIATKIRYAFA
jgi:hypothetical protein